MGAASARARAMAAGSARFFYWRLCEDAPAAPDAGVEEQPRLLQLNDDCLEAVIRAVDRHAGLGTIRALAVTSRGVYRRLWPVLVKLLRVLHERSCATSYVIACAQVNAIMEYSMPSEWRSIASALIRSDAAPPTLGRSALLMARPMHCLRVAALSGGDARAISGLLLDTLRAALGFDAAGESIAPFVHAWREHADRDALPDYDEWATDSVAAYEALACHAGGVAAEAGLGPVGMRELTDELELLVARWASCHEARLGPLARGADRDLHGVFGTGYYMAELVRDGWHDGLWYNRDGLEHRKTQLLLAGVAETPVARDARLAGRDLGYCTSQPCTLIRTFRTGGRQRLSVYTPLR